MKNLPPKTGQRIIAAGVLFGVGVTSHEQIMRQQESWARIRVQDSIVNQNNVRANNEAAESAARVRAMDADTNLRISHRLFNIVPTRAPGVGVRT